jgi:hypothetical protein
MKRIYILTIFIFFAFTSVSVGESLSGVITDSLSGEPVPNAAVTLFATDSVFINDSLFTTTTNDSGYYFFELGGSGEFLLFVEHPDYEFFSLGPFTIIGNAVINVNLIPLNLPGTNFISGRVRDDFNFVVIPNAEVSLLDSNTVAYLSITGPSGDYYISDIEPGIYVFQTSAAGYQTFSDTITIESNTQISNLNIYLTPDNGAGTASVNGLVYFMGEDSTINPVPNANVTFASIILGLIFETTSDDSGNYNLENIPSGQYIVDVVKPGFSYMPFNPIVNLLPDTNNLNLMLTEIILPPSGAVQGEVVFDITGEPVMFAGIHFIPINSFPVGGGVYTFGNTDSSGFYSVDVPSGDYYVMVEYFYGPVNLFPYQEYYDDVLNISEATIVTVVENQVIESINFGIPNPQPVTIEVEGVVVDQLGEPLVDAQVDLTVTGLLPGLIGLGEVYTTTTDINGNYMFLIEDLTTVNSSFIVGAFKDGYTPQYWENKPDMFSADIIRVSSDSTVTGIDFSLTEIGTLQEYSISGIVADSGGNPISAAFIAAFGLESGQIGFGISDENGNYSIGNLPEGIYYVLFYATDYAPQFFEMAMLWEDATPIDLISNISGINAYLSELMPSTSPGQITGTIVGESGQPLSGVMVGVTNQEGEMIDYAMSNAAGEYEIAGLDNGSYSVLATKIKYQSQVHSINMNINSSVSMTLNLNMQPGLTGVENEENVILPEKFVLENNYPNPFNPSTIISFTIPELSSVKLTVYNLIGQEIASLVNETKDPGKYEINFDASNLNSGVYFYKLEATNLTGRGGDFVEMKKMILIK